MFYYIDGYNLIFALTSTKHPLAHQRKAITRFLQKRFSLLSLQGMLVFDGSHQAHEESGLAYASPLEIAYTPRGQTADAFILEKLHWEKKPKTITLVSNDRSLCREARSLGANTQSNDNFLRYLHKKTAKSREKPTEIKDTPHQIERLLQIFEKNFRDLSD